MSPSSSLDLHDRLKTIDFIVENEPFLSEGERAKMDERMGKLEDSRAMTPEERAEFAREVGKKTWAARQALDAYLATSAGCEEEWRQVVEAVSKSTGHLLKRFRHGTTCESLDAVLSHEDSDTAFHEIERLEIAQVRPHIREHIWRAVRDGLQKDVKKKESELKAILLRIEALRELAVEAPWMQDATLDRIARLEDELFFQGRVLDLARLDEEVNMAKEERAIPPTAS